ncbi:MAG: helix-turn-helix transcriptional regulator, partial [Clostridia bacterium]|nr:helix-turn-helix transcriptional regulator [Clostridia bacterium]
SATIRRLRREKGLTQEALAQAMGVSPQAISKWETGQTMPDITLLLPLSKELGIGVNELLGGNRRQELEKKYQQACSFGEEYSLIVSLEALEEFPDDEDFLYRRAAAELWIGERSTAGRRAFYLNHAIRHFNALCYHHPADEYSIMRIRALRALGRMDQARNLEKTLTEPAYKAAALEGEGKRRHLQERIRRNLEALCEDLLAYDTPESLTAYRTVTEALWGDDMAYRKGGWDHYVRKAEQDLKVGDTEGFAASMTIAYETAKAYDELERGIIPCRAPLFDLLTHEIDDHRELHIFIDNYALLSHHAAEGLRRRIVQEQFVCRPLHKYNWREYFRFCCQHINEESFFDFSVQWDSDVDMKDMYESLRFPGYAEAEMLDRFRALAEKLVSEGTMTGLVACFGETIFGFCNCGDKDKYFGLGLEEEERAIPTAPEGSRILAIVEILVSRFFLNSGIEEMLLNRALTDAKKQGFTHAEVYPLERMQLDKAWFGRMLSLYEKMGFRVVRDLSSELDGRYFIMQKEL